MSRPLIGVYPGTFDPITNGHMDIIVRAARLVDNLVVGVAANTSGKAPMFDLDERLGMVRDEVTELKKNGPANIEVRPFDDLLTRFAENVGARVIIRGLRAVSDFDFEFQMVGMNSRISPDTETVFLMASERHQFIASRFVKEIGRLGGDVSSFVSRNVAARIVKRVATANKTVAAR